MILSCSSIKHVNVWRLFSQRHQPNVSPKNRPRYCSAFPPAAKLETLVLCPSKKKNHPFQIKRPQKNTPKLCT